MRALLQLACGLPVDAPLTWHPDRPASSGYAACAAILPQVTGIVSALPPWNTLTPMTKALLHEIIWMIQPGEHIASAMHNAARAGFVLAHASTYADAWHQAKSPADALAAAIEVTP